MLTGFIAPGSDEWRQTISASKVPAILGLSPWTSPRALYHVMAGDVDPEPGNDVTSYGQRREPDILQWFADTNPEHELRPTFTARHPEHPEWTATPDGAWGDDLVEAKTVKPAVAWSWGKPGTAEMPPYYLTQCAWQMVVTGARRVWVPADVAMEYRLYVVNWADVEQDVPVILDYVADFQRRLREADPPDFDGSDSTYQTVRKLAPGIEDEAVTVPDDMAAAFATALAAEKAATAEAKRHKAIIANHMGQARKATTADGQAVATRSSKSGGTPYLTAARTIHQLTGKRAS